MAGRYLVVVALALTACKRDKPSSSDPPTKSSAAPAATGTAGRTAPAKIVPPPAPGERPSLKVGSWTRYDALTTDGEKRGEGGWSVLEKRGDAEYLVEAFIDIRLALRAQGWVRLEGSSESPNLKLVSLRGRAGAGAVEERDVGEDGVYKRIFEKFLMGAAPPRLEGLPQRDVDVPAGRFRDCYEWSGTQTVGGEPVDTIFLSHPAIPAPGFAQHVSPGGVFVLAGYGDTGAKPGF